MTKKLYLVEAQSVHRLYYLVASEDIPNGKVSEAIVEGRLKELGQQWLGEKFCGSTEVKHTIEVVRNEFVKLNGEDPVTDEYLKSFINDLDADNVDEADGSGN